MQQEESLTRILGHVREDRPGAREKLLPLVYERLRELASARMRKERRWHTLQTTGLVHETYLRVLGKHSPECESRAHFFGIAACAMRRILVEHARRRAGRADRVDPMELVYDVESEERPALDVLAVDEALTRLEAIDARKARIVNMRFFGGMAISEVSEVLHVSERTVKREWSFAKAWLARELQ